MVVPKPFAERVCFVRGQASGTHFSGFSDFLVDTQGSDCGMDLICIEASLNVLCKGASYRRERS